MHGPVQAIILPVMSMLMMSTLATPAAAQTNDLGAQGSDIPEEFSPVTEGFNHERREEMIAVRDGVRLFTVILIPKWTKGPMPIVLTRTPYGATKATSRVASPDMAMALGVSDEPLVRNGYIRVYQDSRGKHRS